MHRDDGSARLTLRLAGGLYDRTLPLADGSLQPEGFDLDYRVVDGSPGAWIAIANDECDAAEISIAGYIIKRLNGTLPYTAIPVFPSRMFRHQSIYVNARAGIKAPGDLEGKRIGVTEFAHSAPLWIRGALRDQDGVDFSAVEWVEGGRDVNGSGPDSLSNQLASGKIDALFSAVRPSSLRTDPDVVRMYPDFRTVEAEYFAGTGFFPIMHTVAVRSDVLDQAPHVPAALFSLYEKGQAHASEWMRNQRALHLSLPWLYADIEEIDAQFDGNPWLNGLERCRNELQTVLRYLEEDGLVEEGTDLDSLFAHVPQA